MFHPEVERTVHSRMPVSELPKIPLGSYTHRAQLLSQNRLRAMLFAMSCLQGVRR